MSPSHFRLKWKRAESNAFPIEVTTTLKLLAAFQLQLFLVNSMLADQISMVTPNRLLCYHTQTNAQSCSLTFLKQNLECTFASSHCFIYVSRMVCFPDWCQAGISTWTMFPGWPGKSENKIIARRFSSIWPGAEPSRPLRTGSSLDRNKYLFDLYLCEILAIEPCFPSPNVRCHHDFKQILMHLRAPFASAGSPFCFCIRHAFGC